jgi:hypothetical protein
MTKAYGVSMLINSLIILLIPAVQIFVTIATLPSSGLQISLYVTLGICAAFIFLGYRFLARSVNALKGALTVCLPETVFKKSVFFVGFALLVLSATIHLVTLTLVGYLTLTNTDGVPAGMGSGLGLLVFILSAFFLGPTLKTHNNSL